MSIDRRSLLLSLLTLPLSVAVADAAENCGCAGPKSNPAARSHQVYQMALLTDDPERKRQLAETALRIDPDNEDAKALLAELDQ